MANLSPEDQFESKEQIYIELFEQFILELGQTALYFLGVIPDPETGEHVDNLEGAKHIVDQLEMLKHKTSGNLTPDESVLLNKTLHNLRSAVGDRFQSLD